MRSTNSYPCPRRMYGKRRRFWARWSEAQACTCIQGGRWTRGPRRLGDRLWLRWSRICDSGRDAAQLLGRLILQNKAVLARVSSGDNSASVFRKRAASLLLKARVVPRYHPAAQSLISTALYPPENPDRGCDLQIRWVTMCTCSPYCEPANWAATYASRDGL